MLNFSGRGSDPAWPEDELSQKTIVILLANSPSCRQGGEARGASGGERPFGEPHGEPVEIESPFEKVGPPQVLGPITACAALLVVSRDPFQTGSECGGDGYVLQPHFGQPAISSPAQAKCARAL